jgi:putative spermidine/putrescine transport system ATP-binding protein
LERLDAEEGVSGPGEQQVVSNSGSADLLIEGVGKRFGEVVALDRVSLQVAQGELLTILGPSGSGKTTLLKVVAGFETPDGGSVTVGGEEITSLPPAKRDIGMVFQNYALFPHLTVQGNVSFPLEMRNVARADIDRRVAEAIAMVELKGYEQRLPRQLSGGQQQRVALARAIVFNPRLLLLDEPFGALDRKLRETMQLEVRRLQRKLGLTTIFITHDQEEALVLSDRIAVMNHGTIQQVATTTEIYERPANDFVADFVGESNIFHGTVSAAGMVTLDNGRTLKVASSLSAGRKVGVLMRPERFSASGANAFAGEVIEAVYLGTSFKLRLACEGGLELLVRQPAKGSLPETGARIEVAIEPDAIHVF